MAKATSNSKQIYVYADWQELAGARFMGLLKAESVRGKEVFSFSYEPEWLEAGPALLIDPDLQLFSGPQYTSEEKPNFGLFTDSSPDRWGRVLMERREALIAREEGRRTRALMESDYLLGVHDLYRMGALRFKLDPDGPFLDNNAAMAAPPITSLRSLEEASLALENDDAVEDPAFAQWLNLLMSPGSSLGGARPKASVTDPDGHLWIAKFPSRRDDRNIGAWEQVVNMLAVRSGLNVAESTARRFSQDQHTFLSKRFDRTVGGDRIHFASAMTLLGQTDGADAAAQVSYLQLAEFIVRHGAAPDADLEELWRRIVFYICVSNSDDHLRNHGFLLTPRGWRLSPAYDVNPIPNATGLNLNISDHNNELDVDLAREVADRFRVQEKKREEIIRQVSETVTHWREVATGIGISRSEMERMQNCFFS
ncbi:type II toxin-antitoxin system HipA family toxin [Chitinophaga barathri]|uniref:Type II toxin-antitoxin system HipA family toxin n=1 Tax=Chitinophaga barathri TaxID=1647451 RepID=A0A3N4MD17_9BACT|nr:HipA domain-containing protein [Chitinophaga barathri]RPD39447.1 type II toxin-antitoxin system HipA family toxin [Chitinophaga barathri]